MALASGPFKTLAYKKESTWATLPGASGAQYLRRKTSTLDEVRDTFGSAEIRTDQQRGSFVHGTRRAEGSINGELSGKTYQDFFASLLRRAFTAVSNMTGLSLTIATGSIVNGVQTYTVMRGAGSFLTDGVKVGMVVRITAGSVNANNLNKNLFVVTLTATIATVIPWGNGTMTAEGPIASCTIAVPGKLTYVPTSGHLNESYTIEHWFSDISRSEVFAGCKLVSADIALPPSGFAEVTFGLMGRGFGQAPGAVQYFSSPAAITTGAGMTAVNGVLRAGATQFVVATGATLRVNGNGSVAQVIGSNWTPDVFLGPINANGQMTAVFQDGTLVDAFYAETQTALNLVMYAGTAAAAEFVCLTLPAIKLGGAQKSDGPGSIVITAPFEALYNAAGGAGTDSEATTVWIQDSLAT